MITCTVRDTTEGYGALRRIAESQLPQKAAWRIARLINKVRVVIIDYEEAQLALYKKAGGVRGANAVEIPELTRYDYETDGEWAARVEVRRAKLEILHEELAALRKESVEIDYDPIPLSLFGDEAKFSANDFADAAPFLAEA